MTGPRSRTWSYRFRALLLAVGAALVLAATVSPRQFDAARFAQLPLEALRLDAGKSDSQDALHNILLFVPFGFGFGAWISRGGRRAGWRTAGMALAAGLGLSYAVEVLQQFMPSRDPSFVDVGANGLGSLMGATLLSALESRSGLRLFGFCFAAAMCCSLLLQRMATLELWDPAYALVLGNEKTGDRPWNGVVSAFFIADWPMSSEEVAAGFATVDNSATALGPFVAAAGFGCGAPAAVRELAPLSLSWRGRPAWSDSGCGAAVGRHGYLAAESAANLTQRLIQSSRFTIAVKAAPADAVQYGAGRILSLSEDANRRNFSLIQQRADLVCRLRTAITGLNGTNPELVIPGVFRDLRPRHLAVVYDGATLQVVIDGVRRPEALRLGPGAALASYLAGLDPDALGPLNRLYYLLLGAALGALWLVCAPQPRAGQGSVVRRGAAILAIALAGEIALGVAGNRPFELWNAILGSSSAGIVVLTRAWRRKAAASPSRPR